MEERLPVYTGVSNSIVFCADEKNQRGMGGRVYHAYLKSAVRVSSFEEVIRIAEKLFNDLGYPQMTTNDRGFSGCSYSHRKKKEMSRIMDEGTLFEQQGDLGTFVIRVQHRQHSSWQGKVTWVENNETVCFRSALELIKMIDGVLEKKGIKE